MERLEGRLPLRADDAVTPAQLRALPAFAQHAWRATWLASRLVEPPEPRPEAKATPRRVIVERIRPLFIDGGRWKLSEVRRELSGIGPMAVFSAMQWMVDTKELARVGHGIYERRGCNRR